MINTQKRENNANILFLVKKCSKLFLGHSDEKPDDHDRQSFVCQHSFVNMGNVFILRASQFHVCIDNCHILHYTTILSYVTAEEVVTCRLASDININLRTVVSIGLIHLLTFNHSSHKYEANINRSIYQISLVCNDI